MCTSEVVTTVLAAEELSSPNPLGFEASGFSSIEKLSVDELWASTTLWGLSSVAHRRESGKCPSWLCEGMSLVIISVTKGVCISGSLFKVFVGEKYSEMGKLS